MRPGKRYAKALREHPDHAFPTDLFLRTLKAHGMTLAAFAKERGISRSALYRRTHNLSPYTLGEIRVCEEHFTNDEMKALFPYFYE